MTIPLIDRNKSKKEQDTNSYNETSFENEYYNNNSGGFKIIACTHLATWATTDTIRIGVTGYLLKNYDLLEHQNLNSGCH